jgi:hypothetical protein
MAMPSTTFDDASVSGSRLTHSYQAEADHGGLRVHGLPREYVNGWASGSVVSSAHDMSGYLKTMIAGGAGRNGRILDAASVRRMITPQTSLPLDIATFRMGLGWWVGDSTISWMGDVIHHAGHTISNDTEVMWLPRSKLGVFVSVNTHSPVDVEHQVAVLALGLMVTAKTGRRAPAEPPGSPPVRVPQQALRLAAGRYGGGSGVDVVRAVGDALSWTPSAQQPGAAPVTMTLRSDGWFTEASGLRSIKVVTVAGRQLLLGRTSTGVVGAVGQRIPSNYRLPATWRARTGHYRAIDVHPRTYDGAVTRVASLTLHDGVLIWRATTPTASRATSALIVAGPRLAFTYGPSLGAVYYGAGDGVVASNNTLRILGVTYRKTGG